MKKLFIVPALAFLVSCGGGMSVCDCKKKMEEMSKDLVDAGADEAKMKEIEEKYKADIESCKKLGEGKTEEEQKKMMEEAAKCE